MILFTKAKPELSSTRNIEYMSIAKYIFEKNILEHLCKHYKKNNKSKQSTSDQEIIFVSGMRYMSLN